MSQRTVIRQQQQTGCIFVQPSNRKHAALFIAGRQKIQHSFLFSVLCRGQHAKRLVHHQIYMRLIADHLSAKANLRGFRIYFFGGVPTHRTVNDNRTAFCRCRRFSAGTQSHRREQFIYSLCRHCIASRQ